MIFDVERNSLASALAGAARIVDRKHTIPILSHALLRCEGQSLTIVASDCDMEARGSVAANVSEAGAATVAADALSGFVAKLPPGGVVSFELEADHESPGRMTLRSGRTRAVVPTLPASNFPSMDARGLTHSFDIRGDDFGRALDGVFFAVSASVAASYLCGIHLHEKVGTEGPRLCAVASNTHVISRFELPAPAGSQGMPAIIVPTKAATEIRRLAKNHETLHVSLSDRKIRVHVAGEVALTLTARLIDGTFPDYERAIPSGGNHQANFDSAALASAIDRIQSIGARAGDERRAMKFCFDEGRLQLRAIHGDSGEIDDEIDAEYSGPTINIGLNGGYVSSALAALACDTVVATMQGASSPVVLTSISSDAGLCVISPRMVRA